MFWICAENNIDNTGMLLLCYFLSSDYRVKTFSAPQPSSPESSLGMHKGMGGNTGRKLTPIYPKDIPYHMESFLAFRAG